MTTPDSPKTSNPICEHCGRFLRSPIELERGYCTRCPQPSAAKQPEREERFCCASDPPCPSCPFVVGWDE
jgi:hypothetical protein